MHVVTVASQKGGCSKTTIATTLAVAAEQDGVRSAIFDLDPQASATFWHDTRGKETPGVASIQAVRLPYVLKAAAAAGCQLAIVDTPPMSKDIAFDAVKPADFVLIPARPTAFDLMAVMRTVELVRSSEKPFGVVLTQCPPRPAEVERARTTLIRLGLDDIAPSMGLRTAFSKAQEQGLAAQEIEPSGKAADEVRRLYAFIRERLNV